MNNITAEKKVSHTPGPWRLRKDWDVSNGRSQWQRRFDITSLSAYIATVQLQARHQVITDANQEAEANAKLIAAAPDLLEALKKVIQHTRPSQFGHLPALHLNEIEKAHSAAWEAIQKATA